MWIYSQSSGELWDDSGKLIATGYSGYGQSKNKPEDEASKNRGPIPRGLYSIGKPYTAPNAGRYFMLLTPVDHDAKGRTDLGIHGDSIKNPGTASNGCIILPPHIRTAIHESGDHFLKVVE